MDSKRTVRGTLALLFAVTLLSTCDNDELTEEWALYAFGTGTKPRDERDHVYSPPDVAYSPPPETWTDPSSGLTWQVTPTGGWMPWAEAETHCSNLDLDGGGWRLPTVGELRTLIRGCPATEVGGTCKLDDDCLTEEFCQDDSCEGCVPQLGPGPAGTYLPDPLWADFYYDRYGKRDNYYLSSSLCEPHRSSVCFVDFDTGRISSFVLAGAGSRVRCVR